MPRQAALSIVETGAADHGFTPVSGETLPDLVAAQVYAALVEGRIPPGGHLSEASIARAMGLSRGPVREGLRQLERKGLCEFRVRRGFFVRSLTHGGIENLFRVRALIEQHALEQAVGLATDAALGALAAWRERLLRADRAGPPRASVLVEEDLALHAVVVRLSGNATLVAAFDVVLAETRLALSVVNRRLVSLGRVVEHHAPLVDAILARDLPAAQAELARHLRRSCDSVQRHLAAAGVAPAIHAVGPAARARDGGAGDQPG